VVIVEDSEECNVNDEKMSNELFSLFSCPFGLNVYY